MDAAKTGHKIFDWLVRDRRTGRITLIQMPNPPLWVFAAATVVSIVAGSSAFGHAASVIASVSLGIWAILEIAEGVNPFRRILGALVLTFLVAARLMALLHRGG